MHTRESGVGLLEMIVAVVVIGILGTVMVFTYKQYILRSYVEEGLQIAHKVCKVATGYYQETGKLPKNNKQIGLEENLSGTAVKNVSLSPILGGRVVIEFKDSSGLLSQGRGAFLLLKPEINDSTGVLTWQCAKDEGNLNKKYRPLNCQ